MSFLRVILNQQTHIAIAHTRTVVVHSTNSTITKDKMKHDFPLFMLLFSGFTTETCGKSGLLAVDGRAVASPSLAVTFDCEDSSMIFLSQYSSLWNAFSLRKPVQ